MRASDLRHAIDILTQTRVAEEGTGGATYTSTTFASMYGRKLSGRELERHIGNQLQSQERRVYEIRYHAGITTAMKASVDSLEWRITGIEDPDNGKQRRLLLTFEKLGSASA